MDTKAIAISWLWNTQKSSLIYGSDLGWEWIRWILEAQWLNVKVYDETARQCYHLLNGKPNSVYNFQKAIHELEHKRIVEALEDKRSGLYDVLLFDRTWYDNILYVFQNKIHWKIGQLDFLEYTNSSRELYDSVILLTEPTKHSSKEEFDIYAEDDFRNRFEEQLTKYYPEIIKKFRNGKEDWNAIISFVLEKVEQNTWFLGKKN